MTETYYTQKQFQFNSKKLFPELTPRESEVVFFYSLGFSVETIATNMSLQRKISVGTVKTYLQSSKEKLGLTLLLELRTVFFNRSFVFLLNKSFVFRT